MTDLERVASTIERLPAVLEALLGDVEPVRLTQRPEPGEWSVQEVIAHLIDSGRPAFRDRIASIVAGADEIPSYDPGEPFAQDPNAVSLDSLLAELTDQRSEFARFVRGLGGVDLDRSAQYRTMGRFTARDFVHEWPYHDHDHLKQILSILQIDETHDMSPTMRQALDID